MRKFQTPSTPKPSMPAPSAFVPFPAHWPWLLALVFLSVALGAIQITDFSSLARIRDMQLEVKISQGDNLYIYVNGDRGLNHTYLFATSQFQPATFVLPAEVAIKSLEFRPASRPCLVEIKSLTMNSFFQRYRLNAEELYGNIEIVKEIASCTLEQGIMKVAATGPIPRFRLKPGAIRKYFSTQASQIFSRLFFSLAALVAAVYLFFLARIHTAKNSAEVLERRRFFTALLFSGLLVLMSFYFFQETQFELFKPAATVTLTFQAPRDDVFEVFWGAGMKGFIVENRVSQRAWGKPGFQTLTFKLPPEILPRNLRVDPGQHPGPVLIRSLRFESFFGIFESAGDALARDFWPAWQIADFRLRDRDLAITSSGNDPILVGTIATQARFLAMAEKRAWFNQTAQWVSCLVFGVLFFFLFYRSRLFTERAVAGGGFNLGIAAGFICLLFLPVTNDCLRFANDLDSTEKHEETSLPALTMPTLFSWPRAFDDYFNDHFSFRNLLVRWNSILRVNFLNTAPNWNVIIGKQGWWYLRPDGKKATAINDHLGLVPFTAGDLARLRQKLAEESQWCQARGIAFYLLICPYKSTIYPEFLPAGLEKPLGPGRLDQLVPVVREIPGMTFIDLRSVLRQAKADGLLYYKKDLHWNEYGGFLGYQELARVLNQSFPGVGTLTASDVRATYEPTKQAGWSFDLVGMLNTSGVYDDIYCKVDVLRSPSNKRKYPAMAVIHDSMYNSMEMFLKPACERITNINYQSKPLSEYHRDIEEFKPRILVFEVNESALPVLLE